MKNHYFLTIQKVLLIISIISLVGTIIMYLSCVWGTVSSITFIEMNMPVLFILPLFSMSVLFFHEPEIIDKKWAKARHEKSRDITIAGTLLLCGENIHQNVIANSSVVLGNMIFIVFIAMITTIVIRTVKVFFGPVPF